MKHALIVGCSGIVGFPLSKHLLLQGDWKVTGIARNNYDHKPRALNLICCDLLDDKDAKKKLEELSDVTHLFYVIWVSKQGEEEVTVNVKMFENVMQLVRQHKTLKYVYLQTGTKYYGMNLGPEKGMIRPFRESNCRLKLPNFYYPLEDSLIENAASSSWTYNICRPPCIIGFAAKTVMNFGLSLAVYACILKELGKPLLYPYSEASFNALREFADARLLVQFISWMSNHPVSNQEFNLSNGDYYRMAELWPKIASYFGMQSKLSEKPFNVVEYMADKDHVWSKIVSQHSLKKYLLHEVGTWDFFQQMLSREWDECSLLQKAVRYGWTEQVDTYQSFVSFFDSLKNNKIIPRFNESTTAE
jgi:nucleoside-diphosphate-sugar epimerase